ncbi:MAG: PEP-CTERM sorting domain-containing protein [Gemmatimonadaceae bacterium]
MSLFQKLRLTALTVGLISAPMALQAQTVNLAFAGKIVATSHHPLMGTLQVGDVFTGGLSYNLFTPNTDNRPDFGLYDDTVSGFFLNFGPGKGGLFSQSGAQVYNNIQIGNDRTDYGFEQFDGFYAYGNMNVPGYSYTEGGLSLASMLNPLINAGLPQGIDWSKFLGTAGGPHSDPSLSMGAFMEFHSVFGQGCGYDIGYADDCAANVYGELTDIAVVPEPATLALFAAGLILIAIPRVGRARK